MQKLPWIVAAVAVIALVATLFSVRSSGTGSVERGDDAVQEILARLEALEGRQRDPAKESGMSSAARATSGDNLEALSGRPQQTPEQMESDRKRDLQMLEAAFARDSADPVRGGQVERKLEQTITSEGMVATGLKVEDVAIDCRATTCRVVGQFAKRGDAEDWALFYVTSAGGNVLTQTRMAYVTRPDGSTEVRIYATRARG